MTPYQESRFQDLCEIMKKKEEDIMGTSYLILRKKERLHADSELSMRSPLLFQRLFPGPKGST